MSQDDFFVGYGKVPDRDRRFLLKAVPLTLLGGLATGAALAAAMRDPGDGSWALDTISLVGVLQLKPWPVLLSAQLPGGEQVDALLVNPGKCGAQNSLSTLDGASVQLTGLLIHREGHYLFELDGITPAQQVATLVAIPTDYESKPVGAATLSGEILDAKCYFGVMRPGDGIAHRACASLCIRGGIPPVLKALDAEGRPRYLVLTDPSGAPISEPVLDYVGVPASMDGMISQRGTHLYYAIDPGSLRRV